MGEKQSGGGYVLRLPPEHEAALKAHLEAAHGPLPEGVGIGDLLSLYGKISKFLNKVPIALIIKVVEELAGDYAAITTGQPFHNELHRQKLPGAPVKYTLGLDGKPEAE